MSPFAHRTHVPKPQPKKRGAERRAVVVFGLGQFGTTLAYELQLSGVEVLGVDINPEQVQKASKVLDHVVCADATKREVLHDLAIDEFSKAFVAIAGDLSSSILIASQLANMGDIEIWGKAANKAQGLILEQLGVAPAHIFYPNKDIARRAAHLVIQAFEDYIELGYGYALVRVPVPDAIVGVPLRELSLRDRHNLSIIAVRSTPDGEWRPAKGATVLEKGHTILVVGRPQELASITLE